METFLQLQRCTNIQFIILPEQKLAPGVDPGSRQQLAPRFDLDTAVDTFSHLWLGQLQPSVSL